MDQLVTQTDGHRVAVFENGKLMMGFEDIEQALQFFQEGVQLCLAARPDLDTNTVPGDWMQT